MLDFEEDVTTDLVQNNQWSNTLALRLGGELGLGERFTLRGGGYFDGLTGPAAPAETLTASSPDMARVGGTLGAGFQVTEALSVDAFVEHLRLLERESSTDNGPLARYSGRATVGGLTLNVAVGTDAKTDAPEPSEEPPLWNPVD